MTAEWVVSFLSLAQTTKARAWELQSIHNTVQILQAHPDLDG
jgi:hypothetical protein